MLGKHNAGPVNTAAMLNATPSHGWSAMRAPVLVLNASYEPINVCAARRAIVLVLKGVATTEEVNGHVLHSARVALRVPSVIRLLEYRRIPHQTRALSRKNILLRDRNTCQYCGALMSSGELTLDHVVPRSRGGASTWENLVACCHLCNRRKGNRLPAEASMKLIQKALDVRQNEGATSDARLRFADWWETALDAMRTNSQAILKANSHMLTTWSELARKVNVEAADTMADLARKTEEQAEKMARAATERVKEMVQHATGE